MKIVSIHAKFDNKPSISIQVAYGTTQAVLASEIEGNDLKSAFHNILRQQTGFIRANYEREEIHISELYARKCYFSGKGMNQGYLVGDSIYLAESEEKELERLIKEAGYSSRQESYDCNHHYFTEWNVEDEIEEQNEIYLEDGTKLLPVSRNEYYSQNKLYVICYE